MLDRSVLFTQKNSIYDKLGCDTYDINRNAYTFKLDRPIIAHPPCRLWSRMRGLSTAPQEEKFTAVFAIQLIRSQGGILEHPESSSLWPFLNLPYPGQTDYFGGFSICVNQHWFGHPCRKKTLLYICGIDPGSIPAYPLNFDAVEYQLGHLKRHKSPKKIIPKKNHSDTPLEFAKYLISILDMITLARSKS